MTDREKLLSLCESLGLRREDDPKRWDDEPNYVTYLVEGDRVVLGSGRHGYSGFYAVFTFALDGSAREHAVLE